MVKRANMDGWLGGGLLLFGIVVFVLANAHRQARAPQESELSVAAPIQIQLLGALGDRYLAANIAVWRTLMVGPENLPAGTLKALARVQEDASFLNPGHEDNYVIATATLPWEGFVGETQTILRRATEVRKTDMYAPFFYGFNQVHFLDDAVGAFQYGQMAMARAQDEPSRQALTVISAAWSERGNDPAMSVRVIRAIADSIKDPSLKNHLMMRMRRQEIMVDLQAAVDRFFASQGRKPVGLGELVERSMLQSIPDDPLGTVVFQLDPEARVRFVPQNVQAVGR